MIAATTGPGRTDLGHRTNRTKGTLKCESRDRARGHAKKKQA